MESDRRQGIKVHETDKILSSISVVILYQGDMTLYKVLFMLRYPSTGIRSYHSLVNSRGHFQLYELN